MPHAVARRLVAAAPAPRTRTNPPPRLTSFLSPVQLVRLHHPLGDVVAGRAAPQAAAALVRLLLHTGCRRGEIRDLKWSEVDGDALRLADGKTGPRTVHLSAAARAVIDRQRRGNGRFVFPSPVDPGRPHGGNLALWNRVRERAGLAGVRLHDLRHTYASQAVMKGVPLPVVARLPGHRNVRMTMRYAHVGDRDVMEAAERVGAAVSRALDGPD